MAKVETEMSFKALGLLTIAVGLVGFLISGVEYWSVDNIKFEKFALVVMTLSTVPMGIGFGLLIAMKVNHLKKS